MRDSPEMTSVLTTVSLNPHSEKTENKPELVLVAQGDFGIMC